MDGGGGAEHSTTSSSAAAAAAAALFTHDTTSAAATTTVITPQPQPLPPPPPPPSPSRRHESSHAFWDTQPVPKIGTQVEEYGPLVHQTVDDIRTDPYGMPTGFGWDEIDVTDNGQANEVTI